ncbi:hypothetical protein N7490_009535 [Penicillium lividum]|nr:hypothetical protein N7490_009535 [Penicillium lividum]
MEVLGSLASIIAVIQLTGSVVAICGGYIQKVKYAKVDVITLQQAAEGLQPMLQDINRLLQNSNEKGLPTTSRLVSDITDSLSDLQALLQSLNRRLESGVGKRSMRKFGLRAWKWPLERAEVDREVQKLKRYQDLIFSALAVDRTLLMVDASQKTDYINQNLEFGRLENAAGANFDSFSNRDEVRCLQGTRVEILRQVMDWALSPNQKSIFWLNGMAGMGKSTISRTVAKALKDTNHLGASFFFQRGEEDRGNAKKFFPTLTTQLIRRFPGLRSRVQRTLREDPEVGSKSLGEQFDKLILQPLLDLDNLGQQIETAIIVIDALDECDHDNDSRIIIRLLSRLKESKAVCLRVFLTSRPELPIRLGFSEIANHDLQGLVLHEISEEVTQGDILLFLKNRFATIRRDRKISDGWPADDIIQELAAMSVPLFISAATICRYIEHSKWDPTRRLTELLQDQARYTDRMDKTYLPILEQHVDDQDSNHLEKQQLLQEFQDMIGVIIILAHPLSVNTLSLLLDVVPDRISNRLNSFQSVLSVPTDRDLPVRTLHLSFRDFLVRSKGRFGVDEPSKHGDIMLYCLRTMRRHLRKNICNLDTPGTCIADIHAQSLRQCLPHHLEYSCRYWIHHLERSVISSSEVRNVSSFLRKHFLHWVEAMSLLGYISEMIGMIDILRRVISATGDSTERDFVQDAKRFILKNHRIASEAPLQLYYAGLIFAPQTSIIRREFEVELPSWICKLPRVEERWSRELQVLEGHLEAVSSVNLSPDGRLLASGSWDNTVRLWDPTTGALQQTLEGHSSWVYSVAFSSNGQLLASGSRDKIIRLWDPTTGALLQTLEGHSSWVYSVVFSPSGRLLASGSWDNTVRLWDPATGALQHTLRDHSDSVNTVAFSPDSRLLASGSHDHTIKLWVPVTGVLQQTLEGHSEQVNSVAFSPDGRLLASGSNDHTVRVWDPTTGALQQILRGHSNGINLVAFSPDGYLLVSGSVDKTVRIWNPTTGALQQTLEGHSSWVESVAFSHDGFLLASGSRDKTIRLWDLATGALQQTLEHHSERSDSVTFPPDDRSLASRSYNRTVRLWDAATGVLQQTPKDHSNRNTLVAFSHDSHLLVPGPSDKILRPWVSALVALQQTPKRHSEAVESVDFSPDGRLLASGSRDKTVRLWDPTTGALQQTLEGHSNIVELVVFSPDGQLLASGSWDNTLRLWDPVTGALQQTFKGHSGSVVSIEFSPDGRLLASGSRDKTVRLWDLATGTLQQTLDGHSGLVALVAFSPDGRLVASGSCDHTVRLWDPVTGALQETLSAKEPVTSLWFSQDGLYLNTQWGSFDVHSGREHHAPSSNLMNLEISVEKGRWVKIGGAKILWLPPEYRSSCSATKGNLSALGLASGHIFLIRYFV